ncbi:DUF808 domain-containing protein [Wenxinia marina]|uniref:ABC transporter n=1 Tax=Wenxinia marina DSM 24838 TaxID=1123501 RepID=A0A0D0Q664_9RHOB|nr:DUF808 domain-containing protein [Wenxinia marina]KIQ69959.1 hypothetical protein Wenmar_01529 [Wenxinia marina DSM 24838]GGL62434.1 hypothetical protein GCM10011392_16330 [Wenxinia marina]
MSGLLALLDDVAGIAKVAAASVDDVAAAAAKAGTKTAGVLIDDAAVTPKYVTGFSPQRELPIIWRITRGSLFNKIVILLPIALLLSNFAPWAITPLLMLGGSYLCFEGAEKVLHAVAPHASEAVKADLDIKDPGHLEEKKVRGAIKTDFILSAEIMTIALSVIPESTIWMEAATLAVVGIGITIIVYGSVALIVKADDVGLKLAEIGRLGVTRAFGRGLVRWMPVFLKVLSVVGTAAMLWVGGNIVVHGLSDLGWPLIYDWIHYRAEWLAEQARTWHDAVAWAATAAMDGVLGLVWGTALIPVATGLVGPLIGAVTGNRAESH